jgi:hypothetical protein
MQTLPNGVTVFNATPHLVRFWSPDWSEPVEVVPDEVISAVAVEAEVESPPDVSTLAQRMCTFVRTVFLGTDEGDAALAVAYARGADVVVGSIIAAQAYPGRVMGMVASDGYERMAPAEKRMRPDKFTVFAEASDD